MAICLKVTGSDGCTYIEQQEGELVVLRNEKAARNYIASRDRLANAVKVEHITEQEARQTLEG